MNKYVVVKTHNFDIETEATEFSDYRKANAYLHWMWETYYNEEIVNDSDLDNDWCYYESNYGRIQWKDGDYMEFNLITIYLQRENFPSNWLMYVCE